MNSSENFEEEHQIDGAIIKALNHDIRRTILLELYKHGWGGYTELSKALSIKAGSFYHHMRLLEDSGLVKQLEDKLYEITPQGAQASEFIKGSFSPVEENRFVQILRIYSPFSSQINSFPKITFPIFLLIYFLGGFWLASEYKTSFIGYFIVSVNDPILSVVISLGFTSIGLVGVFIYFLTVSNRVMSKINLASQLIFPETIFILLLTLLSFLPASDAYTNIPSGLIILFTLFYQFICITYYIHVFAQAKIRILGSILIVLLLQQYYHLLILFLI